VQFLQKYILFPEKPTFQEKLHEIPAVSQAFLPGSPLGRKSLQFCSFAVLQQFFLLELFSGAVTASISYMGSDIAAGTIAGVEADQLPSYCLTFAGLRKVLLVT
jgi:hypothetical protein